MSSLPAPEVANDLRRYILEIYDEHLSRDGKVGPPPLCPCLLYSSPSLLLFLSTVLPSLSILILFFLSLCCLSPFSIPPPPLLPSSLPSQSVDYRGISQSRKFATYVRATAELKRVDLASLNREEKLAFFINIYNALVIHAFIIQGPPTSLWKRFRVSRKCIV